MSKLVTIFGGSGFVGRYIVRHMAKEGWRVRVAVRRPNEALFVKSNGAVGQVELSRFLAEVRVQSCNNMAMSILYPRIGFALSCPPRKDFLPTNQAQNQNSCFYE